MHKKNNEMHRSERRTQRRLEAEIPIRVSLPNAPGPIQATSLNLSWGGAQFVTSEPVDGSVQTLRLTFPWRRDHSFSADAEVVRCERLEDGSTQVATRFFRLSPRSQSRLERLLEQLCNLEDPIALPMTEQLEVLFNDPGEICDVFRQIRKGRLLVTACGTYRTNQTIRLSIAGTEKLPGTQLRARIVNEERLLVPGHEWANLTSLELRFEHSPEDLHQFIQIFAQQIPDSDTDTPLKRMLSDICAERED